MTGPAARVPQPPRRRPQRPPLYLRRPDAVEQTARKPVLQ